MEQFKVGDEISGFRLKSVSDLSEYKGTGYTFEHIVTGMQLFHLHNDDEDNLFSFGFKTPVSDDTGVAHILEHSVLSGSERYPVKDPFMALIKGSMNTFINAMTYPDKTLYPASSPVEKDYFNIMSVYADAVFFPLLKKEVFMQEGHRLEFDEEGNLRISGIVYNEMKGVYSNHDSIASEWSVRSLFPDTGYRYNSGGDPAFIPDLKYEDFIRFHRDYYHPSNCRVFLYGNISTEKQLEFLQSGYLSKFGRKEINPVIEKQPRWNDKRIFHVKSPLSEGESPEGKTTILINWLTGDVSDPFGLLVLEILSEILLGNAGAPLYKAVVESGLGTDISPVSGLETDLREFVFSVGLRGSDPDKSDAFLDLVDGVLEGLVSGGFDRKTVEGALKRIEFRNREIRGGAPAGLRLMDKSFRGWLHGFGPEFTLEFSGWMEKVKEEYSSDSRFFEKALEDILSGNRHRSVVIVRPDSEYTRELERAEREKIEAVAGSLTPEDISRIEDDNRRLEEFQKNPDPPEAVESIPGLTVNDLPGDISVIETEMGMEEGIRIFTHDLFTNGIVYIDFGFDVGDLTERENMYLPLLGKMITSSGLPGIPYDEVARLFALHTGGFYSFLESSADLHDREVVRNTLFFRLKFLEEDLNKALELAAGMFFESCLDDNVRLKDVISEMKGDFSSSIIPSGHSYASLRAGSKLNPVLGYEEKWRGLDQFRFIAGLFDGMNDDILASVGADLKHLREKVFSKGRIIVNISAPGDRIRKAVSPVLSLIKDRLFDFPSSDKKNTGFPADPVRTESVYIPASVGFIGTAIPSSLIETPEYAAEVLLAHILKTEYLWETIRMQGGAYGAGASANGMEGVFTFSSYRDPRIIETVEAYRSGLEFAASGNMDGKTLERAVIAVVGKDVRPLSPGEKSIIGFRRNLYGIDDDLRRRKRQWLLETTGEDIRRAAERLLANMDESSLVVIAGMESVLKASERIPMLREHVVKLPL